MFTVHFGNAQRFDDFANSALIVGSEGLLAILKHPSVNTDAVILRKDTRSAPIPKLNWLGNGLTHGCPGQARA